MKKRIFTLLSICLLQSKTAAAQIPNPMGATNSGDYDTIPEVIMAVLALVARVGSIVLVFMIIYSGYLFVTAQGNMEQLKTAKNTLKWAVIGGALLLGAWLLSTGIGETIESLA